MLKIATVCSGIGSPEQALKDLGVPHEIVFACEKDKYARQTYEANFRSGMMLDDMTKNDWTDASLYSDLFIGGIPCQAFSLAGKRMGERDAKGRGVLFYDFYRYVRNQQPKVFIIENVKGLLSDNRGRTFENWCKLLGDTVNAQPNIFSHPDCLGYHVYHAVLNSKNFGVPQNRERVFIVGIRGDLNFDFRFPSGFRLTKKLKDMLEPNVDEKYYLSQKEIAYITNPTRVAKKFTQLNGSVAKALMHNGDSSWNGDYIIEVGTLNSSQDGRILSTQGISQALSAGHGNSPKILVNKKNKCFINAPEPFAGRITGRNPDNPKSRKPGLETVQTLEFNEIPAVSNVISTVTKDNVVIEPSLVKIGQLPGHEMSGRIYSEDGISVAIKANGGGGGSKTGYYQIGYRIRKLTPLECFRLQDFPDTFLKPVSDTQLYKQAGNTITVAVIKAIINNLLPILTKQNL